MLLPSPASVRRLYTLEAELALLLRVGYQNKKRGAQTLFSMGALQHLTSCRAIDVQHSVCFFTSPPPACSACVLQTYTELNLFFCQEDAQWEQVLKSGTGLPSQHDRHHQIVSPVLRIVLCLTSLVETENTSEKVCKLNDTFKAPFLLYVHVHVAVNIL